jgi:hypothetical protein
MERIQDYRLCTLYSVWDSYLKSLKMKKVVKNSIKNFTKNVKALSKNENKKIKGGITNVDLGGI